MSGISTSRRAFMGGMVVTAGVVVLSPGADALATPTIYGDGRRDDTEGLQALLDGRAVHVADAGIVACNKGGTVRLLNGDFLLGRRLRMRPGTDIYTGHCNFIQAGGAVAPYPPLEHTV